MSNDFVQKLKKYDFVLYHSRHPETPKIKLHSYVQEFSSNWDEVNVLITDYSSIGDDFINSGGKNLVYYTPDQKEFETNQGKGIFFQDSLNNGQICLNEQELISNIEMKRHEKREDSIHQFDENFFQTLLK